MDEFPESLKPNYDKLTKRKERVLGYWRQYIYEAMLNDSFKIPTNCGINLQGINMGNLSHNEYSIDADLLQEIRNELEVLGWKTDVSYGNTILFVYTEQRPSELVSCKTFDDD